MADVTAHYGSSDLFDRIVAALDAAGLALGSIDADALAGVDEFHLGGRMATDALLADVGLEAGWRVVDVGCGIGGAARVMADRGGRVVGIDLTPEFIDVAKRLTSALGVDNEIRFEVASALDLPVEDESVDLVTLIHVGMNIVDKGALMRELARVLRHGGILAVYDVMRVGDGDITYPVPWASNAEESFVSTPDSYLEAIEWVGLVEPVVVPRAQLVRDAVAAAQATPPPVNLTHLMGPQFAEMFGNLAPLVQNGVLAPVQIIARKEANRNT